MKKMTVSEYLKKVQGICNQNNIKNCGPQCPLFNYQCGVGGNDKAIKEVVEIVKNVRLK